MNAKPIKPLNLAQCWEMVNRIDTREKLCIAEQWLLKANISVAEYDELMQAVSYISRELYHQR